MNIPEKAITEAIVAAAKPFTTSNDLERMVRSAVEAAAPFIAAQALRDEAARLGAEGHVVESASLQGRADELDPS